MSRERFAQLEAAGMEWDTIIMMDKRGGSSTNGSTALQNNNNNKTTASTSTPRTATTTARQDSAMKDVPKKQKWQAFYDQLIEYKRVHGTAIVPVNSSALGKWVGNQRQAYRAYHSDKTATGPTITAQRIQALNDIGMVWNTRKEPLVSLETRLEQMRKYMKKHGHLRVPYTDASGLSWWLQAQRKRQHTMSRERWTVLEKAVMEWD
jgi:hypothetical protein